MENSFDHIYIYDVADTLIETATGTELAGRTVTVPGNTVKVVLSADNTNSRYGFAIEEITVAGGVQENDVEISFLEVDGEPVKAMIHNRTGLEKPQIKRLYGKK